MKFLIRNILLFHLFLLAVAYSWIHGGTRPDLLMPVIPWLTFIMVEMLLVFPQAKSSETMIEARVRVWRSLVRDPLLYLFGIMVVLLILPLFNVTGEPQINIKTGEFRMLAPPHPGWPSCVDPNQHAVLMLWFIPVLLATLAVRHGLLKSGKRLLLKLFCWNGAALSVLGFVQLATEAESVFWGSEKFSYFFSTFGYPNFAGAFFTLLFALSTGLWFTELHEDELGPNTLLPIRSLDQQEGMSNVHWMLVPIFLNLAGAIGSLSRAAIVLCAMVIVVLGVYMLWGTWQLCQTRGGHVTIIASVVGVLFCGGLAMTILAPDALKDELQTITQDAIVERVSGSGQYHARVAKAIFADNPVFGTGGWGYPHYLQIYLTPEERNKMQVQGGANVHNDTLQMLAEQGVTGFGTLVLCALVVLGSMLWQSLRVVIALAKRGSDNVMAKPLWFFRLSPMVIAVVVGTTATIGHSLGDLPFRCPPVLLTWFLAFVCATGFLPNVRVNTKPKKA